jgi:DNA-binding transcriptional regulator YdaS (Cro superfamily)
MSSVHFQTLEYAATLVGGEEQLALRLGVTRPELSLWLSGAASPPVGVFLKAVDIVTDAAIARLSRGMD